MQKLWTETHWFDSKNHAINDYEANGAELIGWNVIIQYDYEKAFMEPFPVFTKNCIYLDLQRFNLKWVNSELS